MNGESESDKGKFLTRKPSFKNKKAPEVKQTLTSKYRLLKANPLLMKALVNNEEDKEKILMEKSLKTLATALGNSTEILNNGKLPLQKSAGVVNAFDTKPSLNTKPKIEIYAKPNSNFNHSNSSKLDFTSGQFLSSTVIESRRESSVKGSLKGRFYCKANKDSVSNNRFLSNSRVSATKADVSGGQRREINHKLSAAVNKPLNNKPSMSRVSSLQTKPRNSTCQPQNKVLPNKKSEQNHHMKTNNKNKPLRRSLSAQHFDRKKKEMLDNLRSCNVYPEKTQSMEQLQTEKNQDEPNKCDEHNFSTITEESSFNTASVTPIPQFKTPTAYDHRFMKTPNTTNNRRSFFLSTPTTNEMAGKLNEWLKRRGKSIGEFHHLKCFGIHKPAVKVVDEENKENIEASVHQRDDSYEDLKIKNSQIIATTPTTTDNNNINLEAVTKDALQDLHKLILEGYPSEQCECWLKLIKQKYRQLEEDPQYWECRAALEQSKGNINLAVECYKTAIVQGAEVHAVEESLEQLLQKFSLLNINGKESNSKDLKDRARIVQDARNIFKSSIIQFAVQEKTLKKKSKGVTIIEKKLVATPVRRSTRLSRSAYTSTPGVKIYSSLQEVDDKTRNSISFKYNKALN